MSEEKRSIPKPPPFKGKKQIEEKAPLQTEEKEYDSVDSIDELLLNADDAIANYDEDVSSVIEQLAAKKDDEQTNNENEEISEVSENDDSSVLFVPEKSEQLSTNPYLQENVDDLESSAGHFDLSQNKYRVSEDYEDASNSDYLELDESKSEEKSVFESSNKNESISELEEKNLTENVFVDDIKIDTPEDIKVEEEDKIDLDVTSDDDLEFENNTHEDDIEDVAIEGKFEPEEKIEPEKENVQQSTLEINQEEVFTNESETNNLIVDKDEIDSKTDTVAQGNETFKSDNKSESFPIVLNTETKKEDKIEIKSGDGVKMFFGSDESEIVISSSSLNGWRLFVCNNQEQEIKMDKGEIFNLSSDDNFSLGLLQNTTNNESIAINYGDSFTFPEKSDAWKLLSMSLYEINLKGEDVINLGGKNGILIGPKSTSLYFYNAAKISMEIKKLGEYKPSNYNSDIEIDEIESKSFAFSSYHENTFFSGDEGVDTICLECEDNNTYGWNVKFENGLFMSVSDLIEYQNRNKVLPDNSGVLYHGANRLEFSNVNKIKVYKKPFYYGYGIG